MNKNTQTIHYHLWKPNPNTNTKPNLHLFKHNITYYMHCIQNCKNNTYVNGVCTLILTIYTSSSDRFFVRVCVYTSYNSCSHVIPSLTIVSRELQSVQISLTTLTTVKSLIIVTTLTTQDIMVSEIDDTRSNKHIREI